MVAEEIPAGSGVPRPSEPTTVGLESTFNKVWTWLREEKQVGIVGLYGMGGVGKTTLLTQINNESLKKPDDFDVVIWVVVSRDLKPDTVQESIGRKIGFSDDFWKNKSFDEKATDIFNTLSKKRNRHKGAANRVESIGKVEMSEPGEAEDCILSRDESLVDELQCLKELNVLTVTIRSAAALERLSSFQRMQSSTRALHLELFHDSKLVNFSSLANMQNLDILDISDCGSLEEMQIDWERELQKMQAPNNLAHVATTKRPFRSLSRVYVRECLSLRNLNWLILAQNLTVLSVSNCPKMVEVASVEKLPEVPEVVENLNPFAKLKAVELLSLPHLKSFYCNAPPLPSVKDVIVTGCPFLEKWPASQN
ncbi:hypothetical protein OIU78_018507 [Salix suchowensis]|nr:hypothetical protein OIU78_018507 [Salix suchowensis]